MIEESINDNDSLNQNVDNIKGQDEKNLSTITTVKDIKVVVTAGMFNTAYVFVSISLTSETNTQKSTSFLTSNSVDAFYSQ